MGRIARRPYYRALNGFPFKFAAVFLVIFVIYQFLELPRPEQKQPNPHPFSFVQLPTNQCGDPFLAIFVTSAPRNFLQRKNIRNTWADKRLPLKREIAVFFALGLSPNSEVQKLIEEEADMHGDVLQEDFVDSYWNLTHKSIMCLKFASLHCESASYLMKVDDDVFVNIFRLIQNLDTYHRSRDPALSMTLLCAIHGEGQNKVIRNPESKLFLPLHLYTPDSFPQYCSGPAYILTQSLVEPLLKATSHTPYINLEDVYVTGLLTRDLPVQFGPLNRLYYFEPQDDRMKREFAVLNEWVIFAHMPNMEEDKIRYWNFLVQKRWQMHHYI